MGSVAMLWRRREAVSRGCWIAAEQRTIVLYHFECPDGRENLQTFAYATGHAQSPGAVRAAAGGISLAAVEVTDAGTPRAGEMACVSR